MCNCVTAVNERLAKGNGQLSFGLMLDGNRLIGRLLLKTQKVNSARPLRAPLVWAAFCPFCGAKVDDDQQTPS